MRTRAGPANERFILQSQSDGAGDRNPVAFREPMSALMVHFAAQGEFGGLSAWHFACSSGQLSPAVLQQMRAVLGSIASTIRSGPVTHSSGALDTGPVFAYDARRREVTMSAEIWRELNLLGHWIVDAVTVRWPR